MGSRTNTRTRVSPSVGRAYRFAAPWLQRCKPRGRGADERAAPNRDRGPSRGEKWETACPAILPYGKKPSKFRTDPRIPKRRYLFDYGRSRHVGTQDCAMAGGAARSEIPGAHRQKIRTRLSAKSCRGDGKAGSNCKSHPGRYFRRRRRPGDTATDRPASSVTQRGGSLCRDSRRRSGRENGLAKIHEGNRPEDQRKLVASCLYAEQKFGLFSAAFLLVELDRIGGTSQLYCRQCLSGCIGRTPPFHGLAGHGC